MADLSSYLNFSVQLDKSGSAPVAVFTDTSVYPVGVSPTAGVFSITQPDGITISGNFDTPDIHPTTTPSTLSIPFQGSISSSSAGFTLAGIPQMGDIVTVVFGYDPNNTSGIVTSTVTSNVQSGWTLSDLITDLFNKIHTINVNTFTYTNNGNNGVRTVGFSSANITVTKSGTPVNVNTSASKELRLAMDGNFQNGSYSASYSITANGYDPTTITKTAYLYYNPITLAITDLSDVFTPSIKLLDSTIYGLDGFINSSVARSWVGSILYVGSTAQGIYSNVPLFDMAYGGSYYDAHYDYSLAATVVFAILNNAWFSVKDILLTSGSLEAYTPLSLSALRDSMEVMKNQIDNNTYCGGKCGCGCEKDYSPFTETQSIYNLFASKGKAGETIGIYDYITQMQMKFTCSGIIKTTHTNTTLPIYNWEQAAGSGGGSSAGLAPIQIKVGSGAPYAPVNGDTSYVNANPVYASALQNNRYNVYDESSAKFLIPGTDYTKNTNGWTLINRSFVDSEGYDMIFY